MELQSWCCLADVGTAMASLLLLVRQNPNSRDDVSEKVKLFYMCVKCYPCVSKFS